jgi:membrane protein
MLSKIIRYITMDIWRMQLTNFSRKKSVLIRQLRIIILALRGFDENKCFLRASSLTFYFLFSIVPVLAMVFGIAKGFGIENIIEAHIMEKFHGQEEIIAQIIQFAHSLLQQTKGGIIAGTGVVLLLWTVIRVLSNIENSFNEIWGIKKPRSLGRKISDYLAIIFICPILLVIPGSITVAVTSHFGVITQKIVILKSFGPLIIFFIKLAPYVVIWLLFSFIYTFMPNTKVNLRSAVLGGVVAGTIYQILQWAYITFQVGAAKYGAIYGSFAAVPLLLAWIQMSWLIVLFGAEISFAHQNVETYEFERDCLQASHSFKRLASLRIAHLLIKNFSYGKEPLTASQISRESDIPIRLVNEILDELVSSGIISGIKPEDRRDILYQPAKDTAILSIKYVIDTLEQHGSDNIPIAKSEGLKKIAESLKTFSDIIESSPANILLKNI